MTAYGGGIVRAKDSADVLEPDDGIYYRWFIMSGSQYVKSEEGIGGFSTAGPFDREVIESTKFAHLLEDDDSDEWYLIVVWGGQDISLGDNTEPVTDILEISSITLVN